MDASSGDLTCFTVGLNFVTSSNQYFPCTANDGSHSSCCYAGDYCMEDGICHYTHEVENGTGYYMAGCTDSTWQDSSCPKPCTSEYGADVVYDIASGEWNCCVSTEDSLDCQSPSNYTVNAPAPESLSTITQLDTAVPSSAQLTPVGSITSVSAADSASASVASNNVTSSSGASTSTAAANMTMVFSGSPTRNTSTAASTTSESHSDTSERSTVTSMQFTQETAQATRTSAAPSSSSSGNSAPSRRRAAPTLAMIGITLLAAASSLVLG